MRWEFLYRIGFDDDNDDGHKSVLTRPWKTISTESKNRNVV